MDTLPICKARSKQSGLRCKNYATKHKRVCHIHGGKSPGARTKKGRGRQKKALWKHGLRSKEFITEQRVVREIIKISSNAIKEQGNTGF